MTRKAKIGAAAAIVVAAGVGAAIPIAWDAYTHRPAHISSGYTEPGATELTLLFGSCDYDYSVGFAETDARVTVTIITAAHMFDGCADIGNSVGLNLKEPLGGRALIDGPTGERIPVSEPPLD